MKLDIYRVKSVEKRKKPFFDKNDSWSFGLVTRAYTTDQGMVEIHEFWENQEDWNKQ